MSIYYQTIGEENHKPIIVWAHGWGLDHKSLKALAASFETTGYHVIIDFPGFGQSPAPEGVWGSGEYAEALVEFIKTQTDQKIIWIGHSFGGRVGLQLASKYPDLVSGLFLIASAGIPRKRPLLKKLYMRARVALYKAMKLIAPDWAKEKFGSADYKNAGAMREILVKVIHEDLSKIARTITCPVMLVYGDKDTETPPEIGERLAELIPNAEMVHLPGEDHYTVLSSGRHQVAQKLKNFIESHG